ncbi:MAG: hypothetical protein ABI488_05850 [Polyangiaceae bacterium]
MRVTLSAREGALLALVELRHLDQPIGARQLVSQDTSCAELAHALAIVVALAIDVHSSEQAGAEAPPAPRREIPGGTADYAEDDETLLLPPDPSTEPGGDTSFRLGAEVTAGLMPHPQVGLGAGLAQLIGSVVEVNIGVSAFPWSVRSSLPNQRAAIDYRALLGQATVCLPVAGGPSVRAALCAGVSGGAMATVSQGLDASRQTVSPLVNGVLSGTLRFRLDKRWLGFLSAGLNLPWLRKEFVYSALDGTTPTAYRMPQQFGCFGIGLEYELGIRPGGSQNSP